MARPARTAIGRCQTRLYTAVDSHHNYRDGQAIATQKASTLTFRIEPYLKEALRTAAGREHPSIANMAAMLIRDYFGKHGIAIRELQTLLLEEERKP